MFSPQLIQLIDLALTEDLAGGDATTDAIFDASSRSHAKLIAKAPLVQAGARVFEAVMMRVAALPGAPPGPTRVDFVRPEGTMHEPGALMAELEGPTTVLLRGERLALNFLQRMCGVATQARQYAEALGDGAQITDTRKTTPGLRELEKYAVAVGGGRNHRVSLAGGVLIKENHIRAAGGIAAAIERCRQRAPHTLRIEVEVSNLHEVEEALAAKAEIIMLDNMDNAQIQAAIERIAGRALVEVSGNITLERLPSLSSLGVDFISSGALSHSVKAADISLLFEK